MRQKCNLTFFTPLSMRKISWFIIWQRMAGFMGFPAEGTLTGGLGNDMVIL